MRKYLVAAVFAAAVAVLASAAFGSTKSPARQSSAGSASVTCGKTRTIGLAAPFTGPAADIGNQQVRWAKYYVKRWNAQKANKNKQIKVVPGDTQLGVDTAFAVKVAKSFASNSKLLGVVGPAGSQEVVASTSAYKGGKLGFVSGSATRTTLTDGHTDGNRRGYFFRTVPSDAAQGPTVANWMTKKLKWKRVYIIDDQETYSQGLADGVGKILNGRGVKVTRDSISQTDSDFSSKIAKIPSNTQGIYIPWQLAPQAQAFGQQLKAAGKSKIKLFGSDGLFALASGRSPGRTTRPSRTTRPIRWSRRTSRPTTATASSSACRRTWRPRLSSARSRRPARTARRPVPRCGSDREDESEDVDPRLPGLVRGQRRDAASGDYGIYQIQSDGSFERIG